MSLPASLRHPARRRTVVSLRPGSLREASGGERPPPQSGFPDVAPQKR